MQSSPAPRAVLSYRLAAVATAGLAALALFASGCCCCSGDFFALPDDPLPTDEPAIGAAAREYVRDQRAVLFASRSAGPGAGDCGSAAVAGLALDLGVAVITRGHAGRTGAGQVTFNPAACARRVVLSVLRQGAGWIVVGAIVYERASGAELLRVGSPLSNFVAVDSGGDGDDDHDEDVGELFD